MHERPSIYRRTSECALQSFISFRCRRRRNCGENDHAADHRDTYSSPHRLAPLAADAQSRASKASEKLSRRALAVNESALKPIFPSNLALPCAEKFVECRYHQPRRDFRYEILSPNFLV